MVLVTKPMFCDMGNHLRPSSEAPDRPEGQELGGGAVGGQEVLQGHGSGSVLGYGESFETIFRSPRLT